MSITKPEDVERNNELTTVKETNERAMTKRVLWKLDTHILPPLAFLWLANFIDRSNVGNARIAGLERDAHLVGNQFNIALAIFYVSYLLVEIPSNLILKKLKPNRWLPLLVSAWGLVTIMTCFVHNFSGLIAIRWFLGFCEGGLLPGIILYLSTIYKRHELQLRVGIFYASASLSGAFGGLLATAIIKMEGVGGLEGWRWIFILEGLATILIGLISAMILPSDIASASFLTNEEKAFAVNRFHAGDIKSAAAPLSEPSQPISSSLEKPHSSVGSKPNTDYRIEHREISEPDGATDTTFIHPEEEKFEWREVVRGLTDIQTWLTAIGYFGLIVSLYSYSLFLPTIIAGLGYSGGRAQLQTVPPYVPAAVLTVVVAFLSDRLKWRGPFILICVPFAIVGYIVAIVAETNTVRYAAVFLIAIGIYPSGPCILSILPNNSSGHYKKATTTALQLAIANCGGFVATFVYTADQKPSYKRGHSITLGFVCLTWVMIAANVAYCKWENKARQEGRRQGNLDAYRELWDSGKTRAPIGDRHPDFRFTL